MSVSARILEDVPGIRLFDHDGGRHVVIETDTVPDVKELNVPGDAPDETVQRIECATLHVPELPVGHIRAEDHSVVQTLGPDGQAQLEDQWYLIEVHASLKVNVRLHGPATVGASGEDLTISLPGTSEVTIAARPYHAVPPTTITTTDAPEDVLAAISWFGDSVRTTTAERSFPSVRAHPPLLERGDTLDVPAELTRPETGIRLEVPATYSAAIAAAPFAYYVGAVCDPGPRPRLVTTEGFEYPLTETPIHRALNRLLKQIFLLDVVVRTEGRYRVSLPERDAIEPLFDDALDDLYRATPAERLAAYLRVSYHDIAGHLPTWGVAASVPSTPQAIPLISHLAFRLAEIHPTAASERLSNREARARLLRTRVRGEHTRGRPTTGQRVRPAPADAIEQVWFGDDLPVDASLGVPSAYANAHSRPRTDSVDFDVVVGAGKVGTDEETAVSHVYRDATHLPFSVEVHREPSTDELTRILQKTSGFLHYIGHVDAQGFRCVDGHLDARTLEVVGPWAFFLNACNSVSLGRALIKRGSIGGIVTFGEVADTGASRLGATVARLLDAGFPLYPAFAIARNHHFTGLHYLVVGDGSVDIAQSQHGPPIYGEASRQDSNAVSVDLHVYLPQETGMGILAIPYLGEQSHHLAPGHVASVEVSVPELREYLGRYGGPVRLDGQMLWREADFDVSGDARATDHSTPTGCDDPDLGEPDQ